MTYTPVATPQQEMMQVTVPQGMQGGMTMQVQAPTGMMQVQIPMGLVPGQAFQIQVPGMAQPAMAVAQPMMAQ